MAAKRTAKAKGAAGKSTSARKMPQAKPSGRGPQHAAEKQDQKAYLRKRDAAIEHLFLREGLDPKDIAERLIADGTIETKDLTGESAIRLVRSVVAKIRERVDGWRNDDSSGAVAPNEFDALERRLARLRNEYTRQVMIAAGEPDANGNPVTITTTIDTPNGPVVSVRERWPPGVRQKASRDAGRFAEQIAKLELEIAAKRTALSIAADEANDGGLLILESEKSIEELISQNLDVN